MKRFLFTLMLSCVFSINIQATDINSISGAFKGGNASSLSAFMDSNVDLALKGGSSRTFSSNDAVKELENFFKTNKPSGFQIVHNADKKDRGFLVAKLTANGKEYRVNITYRSENNKAIIQSIRIE